MAWNEPGGSKDNDPWGKSTNNQNPPDLDEIVRKLQDKVTALFGGRRDKTGGPQGGGSGSGAGLPSSLIVIAVVLGIGVWLAMGAYVVAPAERGVVTRFGAVQESAMPGLHWNWPSPIGRVEKVNVDEIRTLEIGYRSAARGQKTSLAKPDEALMLTSDENIVDIKFAVQYRIKDAQEYLYKVSDPEDTLQQVIESAVREVVGKSDMDFVLTEGRSEITARVSTISQETLNSYNTGLLITGINMQNAQPPEQVQESFHDAVRAREDEQRLKNDAEAYANDVIPKARGASARQVEEANAYKEKVVAQAQGDADRFKAILEQYRKAPEVTRQRMYMDTMEDVLAGNSKVIVDVKRDGNLLVLPLDKLKFGATAALGASSDGSAAPEVASAPAASVDEKDDRSTGRDPLRSRERR